MGVDVSCAACGKHYQNLKTEMRGKKVRCKCGHKMVVPEESTDDWLSQPIPEAQPVPLQTSYLPPSTIAKPKKAKRRKSEKGDFRPIDFLYMIGGGLLFASGLQSLLGLVFSLLSLPALIMMFESLPSGAPENMSMTFVGTIVLGLIQNVMSMLLGLSAGAMGYYVYEKRKNGKSEYSWGFGYSAIAAVASILFSLLSAILLMMRMQSISSGSGFSFGFSYASLFLAPLPIFVLILYGMRRQLGFKELG